MLTPEEINKLTEQMVKDMEKKHGKREQDREAHHSRFDHMTPEEYRFWVDEHQ